MKKEDLKQIKGVLKETFLEVFEPFATAIQGDFNRLHQRIDGMAVDIKDIQARLRSIEQRVASIEDILTQHQKELRRHSEELLKQSKELQSIKIALAGLQKKNKEKTEQGEFVLLEKRVATLEAQVAK